MKFDTVIVGAGFAGCVIAERLASEKNEKVLIIEKKEHIGGHCYDYYDNNGVLIHKYGPHIFHTNSEKVWNYISKFTRFDIYYHRVLGVIDGQKVPIPFNLNTLHALYPESIASRIEQNLIDRFGFGGKIPILKLREENDNDLKKLADFIYEKVFLHYTQKQWGLKPEELGEEVTGRVPVFISRDNRYFQDRFQGMPSGGYARLFENMLDNPNIRIILNTDYKEIISDLEYNRLVYTGAIDYFFDYKFGELKYRTLDFETEHIADGFFQEVATVNYPNDFDFTRITDYKRLTSGNSKGTTIMKEYPRDAVIAEDPLYYPMFTDEWKALYSKYYHEAEKLKNVVFIGRLAEYRYYNMDAVIYSALEKVKTL